MIDKEDIDGKCRICGEREKTVDDILAEYKTVAQGQDKSWRHDIVAQAIHWELYRKYDLPVKEKWYEHRVKNLKENNKVKVLWDVKIQTDKAIEYSRPDISLMVKEQENALLST